MLVRMWYESPPPVWISIKLGLNFDQAKTNSVMTHVLGFDAKARRNEELLETLEIIGNMFGQLLASKTHRISNLRNKITEKFAILLMSIFLHGKICTALWYSKTSTKSLK